MQPQAIPTRSFPRLWLVSLAASLAFVVWVDIGRGKRVEYVSHLEGRAETVDRIDASSQTGYAEGQRELIVPERNESSFDWIAQAQQMYARGELRVRHVDYENAPAGRDVSLTSPYRWWLGGLAWLDHLFSGRPIGLSVESAALDADVILHGLLLLAATLLTARGLGNLAACVVSVGIAALFPFASGFLPGMPDQLGMELALALVSTLAVVIAMRGAARPARWLGLAGVLAGVGMWVNAPTQAPILLGIFAGALLAAFTCRRSPSAAADLPWRVWGYSAGLTVLISSLIEYFPSSLGSWTLESIHPAYGLALMGLGEILALCVPRILGRATPWDRRGVVVLGLSLAALAAIPALMWRTGRAGFLVQDLLWPRLTRLAGGAVAPGTGAWLGHDGMGGAAWATLLPLVALAPALWLLLRRESSALSRSSVALALGPVVVALGFAMGRLGWWGLVDATMLVLMASVAADASLSLRAPAQGVLAAVAVAASLLGATQLLPQPVSAPLTPREGEELVDRHLAHWLFKHSGGPVTVFAPPNETVGLWFYGGLRGIGSFSPDNRAGFGTTLNLAAATSLDDVQNNLRALGVRYVVIPSWDPFFDEFARLYLDKRFADRPSVFVGELRRMNLPPWLRPIPYQMPVAAGPGQSVLVFEVVDEQAPAAAAGRLAEYLVETGDLTRASAVADSLRRFPGDVGALAARIQVQGATGDATGASASMDSLLARLERGGDRYLPWDRRVSLAIVLVQAGRTDQAREQVRRCIAEVSEERLRSLSTASLYALLVLGHSLGFEIQDPRLRELAPGLLPETLRSRI